MKQLYISLKIWVIVICLLPIYIFGTEKKIIQNGLRVANQCLGTIEICYSFPLANEYTIRSPGGRQLILKGQESILPSEMDLLCIKVGTLHTDHLLVEDKINPLLIMESKQGHFVVYQETKRHLLSLQPQQQKKRRLLFIAITKNRFKKLCY